MDDPLPARIPPEIRERILDERRDPRRVHYRTKQGPSLCGAADPAGRYTDRKRLTTCDPCLRYLLHIDFDDTTVPELRVQPRAAARLPCDVCGGGEDCPCVALHGGADPDCALCEGSGECAACGGSGTEYPPQWRCCDGSGCPYCRPRFLGA